MGTVVRKAGAPAPQGDSLQHALVRGEWVESVLPGGRHGAVAAKLSSRLQIWAEGGQRGCVGVESGFLLTRDPITVRAPDVFFMRRDRIPGGGIPESFWEVAPDFVAEIVSPGETAEELREKVHDYLSVGTPLVWVVYPRTQEVVAYTPDGMARTFSGDAVLKDAQVLPNFTCKVSELFSF